MSCTDITPISAFQSTNLTSRIDTFGRLGDRITRALGAPMITVEIHHDQLYENISIACEFFTKYAGYTEEFLVFDSNLYELNKGIKLDTLFSISPTFSRVNTPPTSAVYVSISAIPVSVFSSSSTLSSTYSTGIFYNQLVTTPAYQAIVAFNPVLSASFKSSSPPVTAQYINTFDYDTLDYRKVMSVTDFEEGSNTGVNTLFTIEQTLAQQTYFSYSMGNYGFDLVSWHILKNWLNVREKMLATRRMITFDPRTQYLVMSPQPKNNSRFYGVISCHVERPIRDIIKEQWVYQYALALSKITVGMVRGKYTGTTLFGGGSLNTNLYDAGIAEKEKLEQLLLTGASPGFGDADPIGMMIG